MLQQPHIFTDINRPDLRLHTINIYHLKFVFLVVYVYYLKYVYNGRCITRFKTKYLFRASNVYTVRLCFKICKNDHATLHIRFIFGPSNLSYEVGMLFSRDFHEPHSV